MKNIKRIYQSVITEEADYLILWVDLSPIIRDENDRFVSDLWNIALKCVNELKEYRTIDSFTFMEAVFFNTIIEFNILRSIKPTIFEIVKDRYFDKLQNVVESHFRGTDINILSFLENRFIFYNHQIIALQNNQIPSKIYSAFFHEDFYEDSYIIPTHSDDSEVKIFNKYLHKMFVAANQRSVEVCRRNQ